MDARMMISTPPWLDTDRLPDLSETGQRRLQAMLEHPSAPRIHNRSGHHLDKEAQARLAAFCSDEIEQPAAGTRQAPDWCRAFLDHCLNRVPFYRRYPKVADWQALPTTSRADLARDISAFVPDNLSLERMICYTTSGTTGHFIYIPSHPDVAARYRAFHQKALHWAGIDIAKGDGSDMGVLLAGYQQRCFTYVSVIPGMEESGLAKLNFHPDDWRHPDDRARYLDAMRPRLITGDPLSLYELSRIPFEHTPAAILSTSMTLLSGQRESLQQRFKCPVLDLFSLNEAGPVAVRLPGESGFRFLQSRLRVELLDESGLPVAAGERGEITLSGGFNDYLPLLRYRTGDFARLHDEADGTTTLVDLEGREPVRFRTRQGIWLNNVDITHALASFALAQFILHQNRNGALRLRIHGDCHVKPALRERLLALFGADQTLTIEDSCSFDDKVIQYQSELPGAQPR